ncbi:MAG: hypothetical protein EBZ13_04635, partial [Planctomycetia bacterium]|nr:hypothetical protein [Planctomycetia bacterium]
HGLVRDAIANLKPGDRMLDVGANTGFLTLLAARQVGPGGLVIAVEPMVNLGTKRVRPLPDHWTQSTADGKPSAHFEHTVAITEGGPQVLTAPPTDDERSESSRRLSAARG